MCIGLLFATKGVDAHPHHGKGKQVKQKVRIRNGVRTGQLTRREAARLRTQQATIRNMKRVARADGRVTPRERMVINRTQRAASRNIYRKKHNCRVR